MKAGSIIILSKHGKKVYFRETTRGWAIPITPDGIRIDNFHGFVHIHLSFNGDKIPIKHNDPKKIIKIIENHIFKNKGIIKKELLEELL